MNKKIYTLMALGTLLFAACSDNVSPISGSTSIPNMDNKLNNPQSPVLCSVIGVTDSLEALEKGCIWSPEMWGPTTGYRVRTGYDNGTNTSGIWTVSTYPAENAYVDMVWPGNATTEYDSMALADVIDKCGGSLCGKALFKGKNRIPENDYHPGGRREVYIDFYLAGKNASGKIESVDASDMGGICVSYSGDIHRLQLILDDSLAALIEPARFNTEFAGLGSISKTDSNVREICCSWHNLTYDHSNGFGSGFVFSEEAVAHLKGLRFVLKGGYGEDDYESEFKIIGISRYHTPKVSTDNLHPVRTDCEPVSVKSSFCECRYYSSDEMHVLEEGDILYEFLMELDSFGYNKDYSYGSVLPKDLLSEAAKVCIESVKEKYVPFFDKYRLMDTDSPCDNPIPEEIMCSDGRTSQSLEFAEFLMEYGSMRDSMQQNARVVADSLFNYCLSL